MTILPDMNELADRLFGTKRAETTKVSSNSETITLYGVATTDSEDGMVSVDMTDAVYLVDDENELIENDATTSIQMPTHVDVREGDEVAITLVGNSTAKAPVVSGVVGGGDRQQAEIDAAADAASAASTAASAAQQKADKAAQDIAQAEQEIADFKANTYTKSETDKKVQDLDDEISTELTTNYYNKNQIDTTYATKTLVSQTKDAIELSASQTYANKGAGNPNLAPFYAHDLADVRSASNADGWWYATPTRATQLADGWAHIVMDNSAGTGTMYSYMRPALDTIPLVAGTLLVEVRNLVADVTLEDGHRFWFNPNQAASTTLSAQLASSDSDTQWLDDDGEMRFPMVLVENAVTKNLAMNTWFGINRGHKAEFDARISYYANTEATIDGRAVTLPYEGSFKPYVTDQQALGKTYATNSALTVGLDGIRQEVSSRYQTIDAMGAYSTTAEMNTAIQTSATGIEQSVAATYSTKQATADAIEAIQVGGRNLITLAETYLGGVNQSTGADTAVNATVMNRRSGYIPVTGGESYCAQSWLAAQGDQNVFIFWYRADKSYIGYKATPNVDTHATLVEVAPSDAAFARIAWRTFGNGWAKFEHGTLPTDYTQAPEDLLPRPNLTPWGTHDFADVYNATTNPDGYWKTTPQSQYFTQLDDGWVHVHIDNSAGTGTPVPNSLRPRQVDGLEGGELVTLLLEVRNNHSTTTGTATTSRFYVQATSGAQLYGNAPQTANLTNDSISYPLRDGESFAKRMVYVTDTTHLPASGKYGEAFRLGFRTEAGVNLDFELRASLYRGGYEGGYVPYSIEDTTLSKTYTKSSTFTQTINGLDGRITATEDGLAVQETLIRQYAGGVLVAYTGNTVGALVNAAGQYDIVSLTWTDGEPTVGTTISSFTGQAVKLLSDAAEMFVDQGSNEFKINTWDMGFGVEAFGHGVSLYSVMYENVQGQQLREVATLALSDARMTVGSWNEVTGKNMSLEFDASDGLRVDDHYLTPTVLFSGSTAGNVTLSETAANFDRLVVYFTAQYHKGSAEVMSPDGSSIGLSITYPAANNTCWQTSHKALSISGTSMTVTAKGYVNEFASSRSADFTQNYISITRVVGYRKVS